MNVISLHLQVLGGINQNYITKLVNFTDVNTQTLCSSDLDKSHKIVPLTYTCLRKRLSAIRLVMMAR